MTKIRFIPNHIKDTKGRSSNFKIDEMDEDIKNIVSQLTDGCEVRYKLN